VWQGWRRVAAYGSGDVEARTCVDAGRVHGNRERGVAGAQVWPPAGIDKGFAVGGRSALEVERGGACFYRRCHQLVKRGGERAIGAHIPAGIGVLKGHAIGVEVVDLEGGGAAVVGYEDGVVAAVFGIFGDDAQVHKGVGTDGRMAVEVDRVPLPGGLALTGTEGEQCGKQAQAERRAGSATPHAYGCEISRG